MTCFQHFWKSESKKASISLAQFLQNNFAKLQGTLLSFFVESCTWQRIVRLILSFLEFLYQS